MFQPSLANLTTNGAAQRRFHEEAAAATRSHFGNEVFVRAVVEVSNFCRENCQYCGMRRDNRSLDRYRASLDALSETLIHHRPKSITEVNVQAGEDPVAVREIVLPLLQRLRPQAHVLIIGSDGISYGNPPAAGGSWRDQLLAELKGKIALERVHFVGRVPPRILHAAFRLSRCHVYLTVPFVLSWSVLEAMACGAVVVGSRTAPVRELIRHGENGLLVDFFDAEALARQVAAVLADPGAFAELGRAARRDVRQRYDLRSQTLPAQLCLVDQLLRGENPAAPMPPPGLAELLLPA